MVSGGPPTSPVLPPPTVCPQPRGFELSERPEGPSVTPHAKGAGPAPSRPCQSPRSPELVRKAGLPLKGGDCSCLGLPCLASTWWHLPRAAPRGTAPSATCCSGCAGQGRCPAAVGVKGSIIWLLSQASAQEAGPGMGSLLAGVSCPCECGGRPPPWGLWGLPYALALGAQSSEDEPTED